MNLNFVKTGDKYVAEFKVDADFNIHIEQRGGIVEMFQSSVEGGQYDYVKALNASKFDSVIDTDCSALIYPKWIKLETRVQPTAAYVVSQGEVVEGVIVETLNTPV